MKNLSAYLPELKERLKKTPPLRILDTVAWYGFFFLVIYYLMGGILGLLTGPGSEGVRYKRSYDILFICFLIIFGISYLVAVIIKFKQKYRWKPAFLSALLSASLLIGMYDFTSYRQSIHFRGPIAQFIVHFSIIFYPITFALLFTIGSILLFYTMKYLQKYLLLERGCAVFIIALVLSTPSFRTVAIMSENIDFHIKFVGYRDTDFEKWRVDSRIYQGEYSSIEKRCWLNEEGYYHLVGLRGTSIQIRDRRGCRAVIDVRSEQYQNNSKEMPFIVDIKKDSSCNERDG